MATSAQRIADLERQVAELAAKLEHYHQQAAVIRLWEGAIGAPLTAASRQPAQRPARHLHAVRTGP
jgi:lipase chaperone LimK